MASLTSITPRNIRFKVDGMARNLWCGGDPARTAFFDGMSIMFPEGEKFFIDAVRENADAVTDPVLKADIQNFMVQEGLHSREHRRYNRMVSERTGDVAERLEEGVKARLALAYKYLSPKRRLAITVALEHFTAILADYLMKTPETLADADPDIARLWLWHAIEENEHKAVAYDVFRQVAPGLGGYLLRTRVMLLVTMTFSFHLWRHIASVMKADVGKPTLRDRWNLVKLFWGPRGAITRTALAWFDFFRPGFHPWDHDNRDLLEIQRERLQVA